MANNVRTPEILLTANGSTVRNVLDIEVQSNSFFGADRFRLSILFDLADYYLWESSAIDVIISVGLDDSWEELIRGSVDSAEIDFGARLIHIQGRDLTARFIQAKTQETFQNQTASEIAEFIASRRGLIPNVFPTTALIGRDYDGDHSHVTLNQYSSLTTEWDLLTKLASNEGFNVWVDGQTLNFAPPANGSDPVVVRPSDCQALHLDRTLAISAGLEVTVKSWDCRAHASVSQVASLGDGDSGERHVILKPNLTEFAAAEMARRILAEISQNSRVITLEWPGELIIRPRQSLLLVETNTDFDGLYLVTSVERRLSFERGFTETLQARTPPWTTF